jgi:hypothetical protein
MESAMITDYETEKTYRIGVSPGCPLHHIVVGGVCFPRRSERVEGYGVETKRTEMRGAITLLTDSQITAAREGAKYKVIRSTRGPKPRALIYSTKARNYRPIKGDEPVTKYLYIEQVGTNTNPYEVPQPVTFADEAPAPLPVSSKNKKKAG